MEKETIQPASQADASASGETPEVDTQTPVGDESTDNTSKSAPEDAREGTSSEETAEKKSWYSEAFGDKYKDEESALKGVKELNTKIGQGNDEAKAFNDMAEAYSRQYGMGLEETKNYLKDPSSYMPQTNQSNQSQEQSNDTPDSANRIAQMEKTQAIMMENQQLEKFFKDNPDAKPFEDQLKAIGRVNVNESYDSIYKRTIEPAFKAGKEASYKKLEEKQSATPQSSKGSVPTPDTSKQDLYNSARKSSDSGEPDMNAWGSILTDRLK